MPRTDLPFPEDWNDLPAELREHVEQWKWPEIRKAMIRIADLDEFVTSASARMTETGAELGRLKDVGPLLDAMRRVRAVLDEAMTGAVRKDGWNRLSAAMTDMQLEASVAQATLQARIDKNRALTVDYWASLPQETLPAGILDLVREWQAGLREECLSRLPLEDRAAVEERDRLNRARPMDPPPSPTEE